MHGSVLTVEECAQELKVSSADVLELIERKELGAKKIGLNHRIPIASFQQYLNLDCKNMPLKQHSTDFSMWADKCLEIYKKPNVTENTYNGTYLLYVQKHIKPYFGNIELSNIMPTDIQQFYTSKKTLSESSLCKIKICLNGIFQTAIDNELCIKNPTIFVNVKSERIKVPKRVFTHEQQKIVCDLALILLPGIVLSLETGIRPGEFVGIKWTDISDGVLHVNRSIAFSKTARAFLKSQRSCTISTK